MDIIGKQTLETMSGAIWYNSWLLDNFKQFLHGDILEIGCGLGNFSKLLIGLGDIYCVDIRQEYIEHTKKLLKDEATVGYGDIETASYFFEEKLFDCVICLNVLEHIKNDTQTMENIYNLLRPGGVVILLVPAHQALYTDMDQLLGHYKRYDKAELELLFSKTSFKIVKLRKLNFLGAIGWWISGKIFKDKIIDNNKLNLFKAIAPTALKVEKLIEPPIGISVLAVGVKNK